MGVLANRKRVRGRRGGKRKGGKRMGGIWVEPEDVAAAASSRS